MKLFRVYDFRSSSTQKICDRKIGKKKKLLFLSIVTYANQCFENLLGTRKKYSPHHNLTVDLKILYFKRKSAGKGLVF